MDIQLKNGAKLKIMVTKNDKIYEYYMGGRKIGVYDPESMNENILILQNKLGNQLENQIRDEINSIEKSQIKQEAIKTKQIHDYGKEIGVENIRDIYTIDIPPRSKEEKSKYIEKNNDKINHSKEDEGTDYTNGEQTKITTTDINIKQAIDLSERANDLYNLKKWLGGNIPPQFTKLVVIDSANMTKMKDENGQSYQRNSTRYDLALADNNGNVEPLRKYIPQLEQRDASGSNPTEQKYQVDKDGKVERDAILSEYEIAGKIIQIDNKEMGRVEVNIGQEEHNGNETLGTQLRDSNSVYTTDTDVRRVMGEYEANGVRTVDENLKEINQHEKQNPDCKKELTYEDIDGDSNTASHEHITEEYVVDKNGEKYTYEELAIRWGKYEDGNPDVESVKQWMKEKKEQNPEKTVKELIEDGDEEYEDPRAPELNK